MSFHIREYSTLKSTFQHWKKMENFEIKIKTELTKFEVKIVNENTENHIDFEVDEIIEWDSFGNPNQTDPYLIGSIKFDGRIELEFSLSIFGRRELDQHILLLNELYAMAEKTITNWNDQH